MVLGQRLRAFIPQPLHAGNREIWTACLGVVLSLAKMKKILMGGAAFVAGLALVGARVQVPQVTAGLGGDEPSAVVARSELLN